MRLIKYSILENIHFLNTLLFHDRTVATAESTFNLNISTAEKSEQTCTVHCCEPNWSFKDRQTVTERRNYGKCEEKVILFSSYSITKVRWHIIDLTFQTSLLSPSLST